MDKDNLVEELKVLVQARCNNDYEEINENTDLILDLGFNKEKMFYILNDIEKKFAVKFRNRFLVRTDICTLGVLKKSIESEKNKTSGGFFKDYIETMVFYAFKYVPYYQKLYEGYFEGKCLEEKEFTRLPIIYSGEMSNNYRNISTLYNIQYLNGNLIEKKIRNSKGSCFSVYWSKYDDIIANREVWQKRQEWHKVDIDSKCLTFHTTKYSGNRLLPIKDIKYNKQRSILSLNERYVSNKELNGYFSEIVEFSPEWISGKAHTIFILAQYMLQNECTELNTIRYIEIHEEYIGCDILDCIKQAFSQAQVAVLYECDEVGKIALECPCHNMHVLSSNVYVEVDDRSELSVHNTEKSLIITNINNTVMPVIRYKMEEKGEVYHQYKCSCGCEGSIIKIMHRKKSEFLNLHNSELLSGDVLSVPIEYINHEFNNPIKQFQFVQKSLDTIYVYLELDKNFIQWKDSITESFLKHATYIHDSIKWKLIYVDCLLPCEHTGDSYFFKSEL